VTLFLDDTECCRIHEVAVLSDGYPSEMMISLARLAEVRSRELRLLSNSVRPCLTVPRNRFLGRRLFGRGLGGWGVVSFTPLPS